MGAGGFVAEGAGAGTFSGMTLRVGSGRGGALRLVLELAFALLFSFVFATGLTSSIGVGPTSTFAFGDALAFALAEGFVAPPEGRPSSAFPVGGCDGWTGWLFGSAASD